MYKVLIVDDERIIREGIAQIIDWKGLDLELLGTSINGLEALNLIDNVQPDIVITDIKMPVMSGLELIENTREKYPKMNFIILSGYGEFELASKAMKYGVKHYILKPCSDTKIVETLKEVVIDIRKLENKELVLCNDDITNAINIGYLDMALKGLDAFFAYIKIASLSTNITRAYCNELTIDIVRCGKTSELDKYFKIIFELNSVSCLDDIHNLFVKLITCVMQDNSDSLTKRQNNIISSIKDYIKQHYMDEDLSLKKIAKEILFMDEGYLSKLFCKKTGEKFTSYVTKIRMDKAKQLIGNGYDEKVYEVAQKVGFGENPQYFSQVFKKYTGCLPSEYNKKLG